MLQHRRACPTLCRCPACPGATRGAVLSAWADEMSAFLSCVDPNHMIHVGSEGYFTETAPEVGLRLGHAGTWAAVAAGQATWLPPQHACRRR